MNALKHFTSIAALATGLAFAGSALAAPLGSVPSCGDDKHGDEDKKKDEKNPSAVWSNPSCDGDHGDDKKDDKKKKKDDDKNKFLCIPLPW